MTSPQPWLLAGQAHPAAGESHLQDGVHLRVEPSQLLGFPLEPMRISRQSLGYMASSAHLRTDVRVVDQLGRTRTFPLRLQPGERLRVTFRNAPGTAVCWARVLTGGHTDLASLGLATGTHLRQTDAFAVTAVRLGMDGESSILARRTRPEYAVSSSHIDALEIIGRGVVRGVQWLDSRFIKTPGTWRLMGPPSAGAQHYQADVQAIQRASARVMRGAPKAYGLHDRPDAVSPASPELQIPLADQVPFELARMTGLAQWLQPRVQQILDSDTPWAETEGGLQVDNPGDDINENSVEMPLEALLFQGTIDHGVGRFLGLVDRDEAPPGGPGDVILYTVTGRWGFVRQRLAVQFGLPKPPDEAPSTFTLQLAVTLGCPSDPPLGPKPVLHDAGRWLPGEERLVQLRMNQMPPACGLAFARRGAPAVGLNRLLRPHPDDPDSNPADIAGGPRASLLLPSEPSGEVPVGQRQPRLHDLHAPTDAYTLQVASVDGLGRWGTWFPVAVPALVRPGPPRASVELRYDMAAEADHDGLVAGVLTATVPVPPPHTRPPGSRPLLRLVVKLHQRSHPEGAWQLVQTHTEGAPFADTVTHTWNRPALNPAEVRYLKVVAHWEDGTLTGEPGQASTTATDPRRPPAPVVEAGLRYGSHPDALGLSRIPIAWTPTTRHAGYVLYSVGESRVRAFAESNGLAALLPDPTAPPNERSVALRGVDPLHADDPDAADHDRWPRKVFERLNGTPIPRRGLDPMLHELRVSGANDQLVLIKVVAVADNGRESDFNTSPLIVRGIPSAPPPTRPLLERIPASEPFDDAPEGIHVRLRVRLPRGGDRPIRWRLRRSRARSTEPERMPISTTGDIPEEGLTFDVIDQGSLRDFEAPLQPWNRYAWSVEVQAPNLPGSEAAGAVKQGRWSQASDPVSTLVLGPEPVAPTWLSVGRLPDGRPRLRFRMAEVPLLGGDLGIYALDVVRLDPAGQRTHVVRLDPASFASVIQTHTDADPTVLPGTRYSLVLSDPIGRSTTAVVSEPLD